jgi:hypothetical protein
MTKVEELQQTYSAKARETRREMNALAQRAQEQRLKTPIMMVWWKVQ